ncbi:WD repeat-containing protein 75 [Podochytrium sp. JEL0797]|nr:WD repeat-containing protein 75 [Podochytrium sp. JEL0797]
MTNSIETSSLLLSGGIPSAVPVSFVSGGRFVCAAVGSSVSVTSTLTGLKARRLCASTSANVVSTQPNNENDFLLYVAHSDGNVNLWDVADGSLIKGELRCFKLDKVHLPLLGDKNEKLVKRSLLGEKGISHPITGLDVSSVSVVAVTDIKVWLWDLTEQTGLADSIRFRVPKKQLSQSITTVSLHPHTPLLALGLTSGEILIYHNPFNTNPAVQILHWHAHTVTSLCFMNDGTTLISGGKESVLVLWQLATLSKQTIPRLAAGTALLSLAVSKEDLQVGVVCGDACVRVVKVGTWTVQTCVTGLKAKRGRVLQGNALAVETRTGNLVVAGNAGCLQFYDAVRDAHVMEVECVAQNQIVVASAATSAAVTGVEHEAGDGFAVVTKVAFEQEGRRSKWMATVDERENLCVGGQAESSLKFWMWDDVNQIYSVNTRVSSPHTSTITSLRFFSLPNPDSPIPDLHVITTSLDTRFKIWSLAQPTADSREDTASWSQTSQGFFKDLPIHASAVSHDASMIAVGCGNVVTLWDPSTTTVCPQTLCNAASGESIVAMEFVGGNSDDDEMPCLVVLTAKRVSVWNLLTGTVWWSLALGGQGASLTVDPDSAHRFTVSILNRKRPHHSKKHKHPPKPNNGFDSGVDVEGDGFTGVVRETQVLQFSTASPLVEGVFLGEGEVFGVAYLSGAMMPASVAKAEGKRMVVLSNKFEIMAVGPPVAESAVEEAVVPVVEKETVGLFTGIYGSSSVKAPTPAAVVATPAATGASTDSLGFMQTASHLLPPPTKLASAFFDAVLTRRDATTEATLRATYAVSGPSAVEEMEEEESVVEDDLDMDDVGASAADLEGLEFLSGVLGGVVVGFEGVVPVVSGKAAVVVGEKKGKNVKEGGAAVQKVKEVAEVIVLKEEVETPAVVVSEKTVTGKKRKSKK